MFFASVLKVSWCSRRTPHIWRFQLSVSGGVMRRSLRSASVIAFSTHIWSDPGTRSSVRSTVGGTRPVPSSLSSS